MMQRLVSSLFRPPPADVADIECNLPGVAQAPEHNFCLRVKSEHKQLKCSQEKDCDQYHCFDGNPFGDGVADGYAGTVSGTISSRAYFEGAVAVSGGAITAEVTMLTIEGTTYTGKFIYSLNNNAGAATFGLSLLAGSSLRKEGEAQACRGNHLRVGVAQELCQHGQRVVQSELPLDMRERLGKGHRAARHV